MKTLFVTVDPAFPPISGADLRNWQNAAAARKLGPVMLVSIGTPHPSTSPSGIEIFHLEGMKPSELWASDFDVVFTHHIAQHLRSISKRFQPDVTVLESLPLVNLAGIARTGTKAVVLDMHNVESDLAVQAACSSKDLLVNHALQMRAKRIALLEQHAAASVDAIWVCSSVDRDRFIRVGIDEKCISIVPNGIPRPESVCYQPSPKRNRLCPTLLFIGHLRYPPNLDAVLWLMQLMPMLWHRIPGARLVVAGRDPHPLILQRSDPGRIDVVGNPVSVNNLLSDADIAVMPLRRGGGTRIKALEAMAWGLPIIGTRRAVEGLEVLDGVQVRIAETADTFVAAVAELCENAHVYESQRTAAHLHVKEHFGLNAIRRSVRTALSAAREAARRQASK